MNKIYNQLYSTASHVQIQDSFQDINILNSAPSNMKDLILVFLRKAFWFCPIHTEMATELNGTQQVTINLLICYHYL